MTGNFAVPYEEPLDFLFQFASNKIMKWIVGKIHAAIAFGQQTYNPMFCPQETCYVTLLKLLKNIVDHPTEVCWENGWLMRRIEGRWDNM